MSEEEDTNQQQNIQQQQIKYGSIISISHFQDNNAFISADGHINSYAYLYNFGENSKKKQQKMEQSRKAHSQKQSKADLYTKFNFSNTLFVIFPKSSNKDKMKILEKLNLDSNQVQESQDNINSQLQSEDIEPLKIDLLKEYYSNFENFKKSSFGLPVNYNQSVQLMHLNSAKFLSCRPVEASYQKDKFSVSLDDYTSEHTMFKFTQSFNYQKDGDQVIFANEITYIERFVPIQNKPTFLHSSGEMAKISNNSILENKSNLYPMQNPSTLNLSRRPDKYKEEFTKREINGTNSEDQTAWKLNLFNQYPIEQTDQIFSGDIVWLHHSEVNSIIASKRIDKGVDKYNFSSLDLGKWLDLDNLELNLTQSQTGDEFSDYSGNTFGMWIIQSKSQQEGGSLVFEKEYRLRHMSTGCFLSVKRITNESEQQQELDIQQKKHYPNAQYKLCLTPAADQSTLFTFEQLQTDKMKNQSPTIENGQFTFIKNTDSEKYINVSQKANQPAGIYQPGLQTQRQDNQLFRLYKAAQEEVWEVNFILSTFRCLTSFALSLEKLTIQSEFDEVNMNLLIKQIVKTSKCINMLTDFVVNKLGNSQPEQVFGTVNAKRQKLLQEQYFIEVLVKILEDALTKSELERWEELNQNVKNQTQNSTMNSQDIKQMKKRMKDGKIDEGELFNFLNQKINLCKQIYILLQRTANENPKNQELIFTYLPFFQIHAKYIPEACVCMAEITSKNENLLFNLSVSLKINFDHKQQKIVEKSENNTVKFLINLYDGHQYDSRQEVTQEQHIQFRQHEKLIVKPVNLIQFFMNLIWDAGEDLKLYLKNHPNSTDLPKIPENINSYLDFLSSICRFEEKGISLNQEIIYKFYKTYSSVRKVLSVKYFEENYIQKLGNKPEQVDQLKSLMKFYSDLAYGRNFLWKDYLQQKFNEEKLYTQIWENQSDINRFQLSAYYTNLVQSLFIDHDPLVQVNLPNYCRLYIESNSFENQIKVDQQKKKNLQILTDKIQDYLQNFNQKIVSYVQSVTLVNNAQSGVSGNLKKSLLNSGLHLNQPLKIDEKLDFLKDDLLKNTLYLLSKLNQLNVFKILDHFSQNSDYLPKLLKAILTLLQYNKNNIKFVSAIYNSEEKIINQKIKTKKEQSAATQMLGGLTTGLTSRFSGISSLLKKKETENEKTDLNNDTFKIDKADMMDPQMFRNPFMRGFIKLNNCLENIVYEDSYQIQTELEIKKTICKMLSNFIDQRQDFLMQNALSWFKDNLSVVTENNKEKLPEVTQKLIENIMPLVGKTGIICIDDDYHKKQKDKYKSMKLYLQRNEKHQIPIFHDLDTILSRTINPDSNKDDNDGNPVCSVLPKLLANFFLVTDENLKQMVLKVILRLFNQRLELQNNLNQMLVLFEKDKIVIYKQCEIKIRQLKQKIEKSEIWLAGLGGNDEESCKDSLKEVCEISEILKTLKNAFYLDTYISKEANGDFKICMAENNQLEVDEDKQQILRYLNLQNIIMQLINDGVPHASNFIMDSNVDINVKEEIILMFTLAHQVLQTFVQGNPENQKSMIGECINLLRFANYDFGQVKLVCEIYRSNYKLLEKFDRNLLVYFSDLIEKEGRQQHFLEFFEVVQAINSNIDNDSNTQFIFENQLLVLSTFLPIKENAKKEIKLLYADGSDVSNIALNFEDTSSIEELNFLEKLKEVGFRDTYRDEPFLYHARLLDLILKTTLEQCTEYQDHLSFLEVEKITFNISINKVKKIFSFMYLLQILEADDDYFVGTNSLSKKEWLEIVQNEEFDPTDMKKHAQIMEAHKLVGYSYLKPFVMNFLRCVHILSDKDLASDGVYDELGEITYQQLHFSRFLDQEARKIHRIKDNTSYTDEYVQYLFMYLISTIVAYVDKYFPDLKHLILQNQNDDDLRQDQLAIKNFCFTLAKNYKKFNGRVETRQEQRMQKLMGYAMPQEQVEMLSVEKKLTFAVYDNKKLKEDRNLAQEQQDRHKKKRQTFTKLNSAFQKLNVINKLQVKELELRQQKEEPDQIINLDKKVRQNPLDLPENQKLYWKESFIGNLLYMDEIDDLVDQERQALADAILNVDKLCDAQYQQIIEPKPSKELILQKLIDFLVNSIGDEQNKQTNIALIKVLIQIIYKNKDDKVKKLEMQNLFEKLGAINMILYVISENHKNFDGDLFQHFLIFINALLDGGNLNNQTAVYNYFIHNKKSEIIFQKFQQYFDKQITSLQAKAKKKKLDKQKRKKKTDELEEENAEQEDEDIFCSEQDIIILGEILNFLQNCVENHNLDLQNYLRNQWNHRNKYDMVNAVADLLKTYYRDARTQDMYDNMQKCLDTLSEFIQGPCPENQMAVAESKFFEVFQEIFEPVDQNQVSRSTMSMRTKKSTQGMKSKKSTMGRTKKAIALEEWHIARLQNKCLILALSLLEKRDVTYDKTIIKQILRHLPIHIVEHHLLNIYGQFIRQYKSQYKQDCLSHLDEEDPVMEVDVEDEDEQKNKGCCKKIKEKIIDAFKDSFQLLFQVLGLIEDKITPQQKYAFILQNGFYLFFIFSYYMESGERIEGNIVNEYRAKQKSVVSNKKNFLQKFIEADNILSQIFKLVWTIALQILERLDYVRIQILEKSLKSPDKQTQEQKKLLNKRKLEEKKKLLKSTLKFFYKNTAHIDIVRDDQLEQIFFIKLPYTHFMPKEKKTEFNNTVQRTNLKSKVEGLTQKSYEYIEICKHEEYLNNFFQKNKFLAIFANYVKLWKDLAFILTLLLNVFILLSYSSVFPDDDGLYEDSRMYEPRLFMLNSMTTKKTKIFFFIFGVMMSMCSAFVVGFFLIKNLPLVIQKVMKKNQINIKEKGYIYLFFWLIIKVLQIMFQILQEIEVIYYIMYLIFAFFGTFWHPFFFVFHLTEILIRYPTLKSVIDSVYQPRGQLFLTYVLFIIVLYIFTLTGYQFLREDYLGECEDLFWCFMLMLDYTFKSNGGIGGFLDDHRAGYLEEQGEDNFANYKLLRFVFDTLFNLIIVIILVNIVSGIIIDTFGQLREEETKKLEDIEDKCFICGNKKTEFDRQSQGGFNQHIRINHYMWNYMFYIAYLDWKNKNDYTGVESYIWEKLQTKDCSWFPLNKARELQNLEEKLQQQQVETFNGLSTDINGLIKETGHIQKKFQVQMQFQQQQY